MTRARLLWLVLPASIAAAFAAGLALGGSSHEATAPAPVPASPPTAAAAAAPRGLSADEVRRIVRDELANAPARAAGEAATDKADAEAGDPDALARAHEVLAAGMADGRWSIEDRAALRQAIVRLARPQIDEIFATLFPAINAGQLRLDSGVTPL